MTKIKLKNWRDERGSQLERAKKVLMDKDIDLHDLSRLVRIPYLELKDYQESIDNLHNAYWEDLNKLAQAYDIIDIQNNMNQNDIINTQNKVNYLFNQLPKNDFTKRLKQIITSDPLVIYELFKTSK